MLSTFLISLFHNILIIEASPLGRGWWCNNLVPKSYSFPKLSVHFEPLSIFHHHSLSIPTACISSKNYEWLSFSIKAMLVHLPWHYSLCLNFPHSYFHLFLFILFFFTFYSTLVDWQYYVNLCCTAKWLSFTHMYCLFKIFFSIMVYPRRLDIVPCAVQ